MSRVPYVANVHRWIDGGRVASLAEAVDAASDLAATVESLRANAGSDQTRSAVETARTRLTRATASLAEFVGDETLEFARGLLVALVDLSVELPEEEFASGIARVAKARTSFVRAARAELEK
jgi:outer membrane protein TolC